MQKRNKLDVLGMKRPRTIRDRKRCNGHESTENEPSNSEPSSSKSADNESSNSDPSKTELSISVSAGHDPSNNEPANHKSSNAHIKD